MRIADLSQPNFSSLVKIPLFWQGLSVVGFAGFALLLTSRMTSYVSVAQTDLIFWCAVLWLLWQKRDPEPEGGERLATVVGLGLMGWVLQRSVFLFWFESLPLRGLILAGFVGWLILAFGFRGLSRHWSALVAVAFMVAPLEGILFLDRYVPFTKLTAAIASFLLHYIGFTVERQDVILSLPTGSVKVLYFCTGGPLITIMLRLAVLFLLVFPLRWRQRLMTVMVTFGIGSLLGIVRVALLAVVVHDGESFEFWHGGEGSAIFSMAAMFMFGGYCYWLLEQDPSSASEFRLAESDLLESDLLESEAVELEAVELELGGAHFSQSDFAKSNLTDESDLTDFDLVKSNPTESRVLRDESSNPNVGVEPISSQSIPVAPLSDRSLAGRSLASQPLTSEVVPLPVPPSVTSSEMGFGRSLRPFIGVTVGIALANIYGWLNPMVGKREVQAFAFPPTYALPTGQFLESQPLDTRPVPDPEAPPEDETAEILDVIQGGHEYRYGYQGTEVRAKLWYVVGTRGNVASFWVKQLGGENVSIKPFYQPGLGHYGLFEKDGQTYLTACLLPQGGSTVTGKQFLQASTQQAIQPRRLLPALIGQVPFRDQRCLWVLLSTPTDSKMPQQATRRLRTFWQLNAPQWQAQFPPL